MVQRAGGRTLEVQDAALQWRLCRDLKLPFFTEPPAADQVLWRASVAQTTPVLALPSTQLIEWHGGLRWFWKNAYKIDLNEKIGKNTINNAIIFISNNEYYSTALFEKNNDKNKLTTNMQIQHRLKTEFDPQGIFNRGRLYPGF
jgi:glycolate oxidase FAD binding subunit